MIAIPGVTITRNAKGKPTHINIDLRKHQEVIPVLKEMGLLPETEADIDVEDTVTLDEFNSELESAIHNHYANTR